MKYLTQLLLAAVLSLSAAAQNVPMARADAANVSPFAAAWRTAIGAKQDSMATGKLLGRSTAGTGAVEEITLGTNLSFTGTTLNAAGGTVDNPTVNAAIATNTAASRLALELGYLPVISTAEISDVVYTAKVSGVSAVKVTHVVSGAGTSVISVGVAGNEITVTAGSATTASTVVTAVNGNAPAFALVAASTTSGSSLFLAGYGTLTLTNAAGNFQTGPVDNRIYDGVLGNATTGYRVNGFGSIGNITIPDQQGLLWKDPANNGSLFSIRHWRGHDAVYGEAIIESAWRIAMISQGPIQFGQNDVNQTAQCLHMTSGGTSPSNTLKHSKAISQQTKRYNGGAEYTGYSIIQTTSDTNAGAAGTVLKVNITNELTSTGNAIPVNGFNGGGDAVNAGKALGDTVMEIRTTGTTIPALNLSTAGGITFDDSTTLSSTDDILALIPAPRTGHVELVAGEATVADASITGFTQIIVSHKTAAGTLGHLSTVKDYGVGFDIVSSSAPLDTSTVSYLLVEGAVSDIAPPSISGTTEIGDTLTTTGGVGARQWKANGSSISGETAATYVIGAAYIGQSITCERGGVPSNALVAWHPDDETGYFADFRADAGTFQADGGSAATADADPVGEWEDQSGNNRHMVQATAAQKPQMATTGGYRNIFFDSAVSDGDWLYRSTVMSAMTLPQTCFVVGARVSASQGSRMFTTIDSGQRMMVGSNDANQLYNGNSNPAIVTGWAANTRGIITARTTSTNSYCSLDGGSEASGIITNTAGQYFFAGGINATTGLECRVNAILFYNADLAAPAQARVRKYLKAKWGTP